MKAIRFENEQIFEWAAAKFGTDRPGDMFGNKLIYSDVVRPKAPPKRHNRRGYKSKNKIKLPTDIVNKVRTKDRILIEQTRSGDTYLSKETTRLLYTKSYGTKQALKDFRLFIDNK